MADKITEMLESLDGDELRGLLEALASEKEKDLVDEASEAVRAVKGLLDDCGVKYSTSLPDCVAVGVEGDGGNRVTTKIICLHDGGMHLRSNDLVSFGPEARPKACELACELNAVYRFVKFCIDDDDTMHAELDLPGHDTASMGVLLRYLTAMTQICFDALPRLGVLS